MKVLLDTQVILWSLADDDQLGKNARALINDATISKLVSSASIWEMEIKAQLGRLEILDDLPAVLLASGIIPLPISWHHAQTAGALPRHHGDPFDRMLIAQAQCDGLALLSSDDQFSKYQVALVNAKK
jgi:PIN domain nuclease of toxin-antitoxin system